MVLHHGGTNGAPAAQRQNRKARHVRVCTKLNGVAPRWNKRCASRAAAEQESPPREWREGESGRIESASADGTNFLTPEPNPAGFSGPSVPARSCRFDKLSCYSGIFCKLLARFGVDLRGARLPYSPKTGANSLFRNILPLTPLRSRFCAAIISSIQCFQYLRDKQGGGG